MGRRSRVLGAWWAGASCGVIAPVGYADEPGSLPWFEAQWASATAFRVPERTFVEFAVSTYPTLTSGEVERLAHSIADTPDHPDWLRVRMERRLLDLGEDRVRHRLWVWNQDDWRASQDLSWEQTPFIDVGISGENMWAFTPPQLTLGTRHSLPQNRQYAQILGQRTDEIGELLYVGMGIGLSGDLRPVSVVWKDGVWIGRAASARGDKVIAWYGRRIDEEPSIIIDRWRVLRSDQYPKAVGLSCEFESWAWQGSFKHWSPSKAVQRHPDGRPYRAFELLSAFSLSRSEFNEVSRAPEPGRVDAIRGLVEPDSVADYRPGRGVLVRGDGADASVVALPDARSREAGSGLLAWGGRCLAGLGISLALLVAWRRLSPYRNGKPVA